MKIGLYKYIAHKMSLIEAAHKWLQNFEKNPVKRTTTEVKVEN